MQFVAGRASTCGRSGEGRLRAHPGTDHRERAAVFACVRVRLPFWRTTPVMPSGKWQVELCAIAPQIPQEIQASLEAAGVIAQPLESLLTLLAAPRQQV